MLNSFVLVLLLWSARCQPTPSHCYEFANQPGDIPDSCGSGNPLQKQGTPSLTTGSNVCPYSGCKVNSGDAYVMPVPSDIGEVFTLVMWVWGNS